MSRTIILDCDPGIDDALALILALASPELDVKAVTAVSGNRPVDQTFENARRLVALAGRADIPVFRGAQSPLDRTEPRSNLVHGEDGLGGVLLPHSSAPVEGTIASQALLDILASEPEGTVTLVAIGPLTNLALAFAMDPDVFRRAERLAFMGGAVHVPGNVTPAAEFNFWADPLAADRVLQAGVPVELFGLDVTTQAICTPDWLDAIVALPGPVGAPLSSMISAYFHEDPLLHDPCPLAWLIAPALFKSVTMCVRVETSGRYSHGNAIGWTADRPDAPGPVNANVHVQINCDGLLDLMLDRIRSLSERTLNA